MPQPLRLEDIVEKALAARPKSHLLSGLGAKIAVASDLPSRRQTRERLATGVEPLDRLLPGGLPRGQLIEIVGRRSSGRFSIGLATLASVTSAGEPAALLDPGEHLDPEAAAAAGVDLELLLWVRPRRVKETLAAAEMLLAAGFPLIVADFGLSARGGRFVPDAAWIRRARVADARLRSSSPDSLPLERHRRRRRPDSRLFPSPLAGRRGNPPPPDRPLLPPDLTKARPRDSRHDGIALTLRQRLPRVLRWASGNPHRARSGNSSMRAYREIRVMPGNPSKPGSKLMIRATPCRFMTAR